MEQMAITYKDNGQDTEPETTTERKPFIEANTTPMTYQEIQDKHIIPVFVKDNELAISQTEFIDVVKEVASTYYGVYNLQEDIRVSHPILKAECPRLVTSLPKISMNGRRRCTMNVWPLQ